MDSERGCERMDGRMSDCGEQGGVEGDRRGTGGGNDDPQARAWSVCLSVCLVGPVLGVLGVLGRSIFSPISLANDAGKLG